MSDPLASPSSSLSGRELASLKLTDNFRPEFGPYSGFSSWRPIVSPNYRHANPFQSSGSFTKLFVQCISAIKNGNKNPMDLINLCKNNDNKVLSIKEDIIPILKEEKRTIQICSRRKKTSFSAQISNNVLLGDFLEKIYTSLNVLFLDINSIIPDSYNETYKFLPYLTHTTLWNTIISKLPNKTLEYMRIKTKDSLFDSALFYNANNQTLTNRPQNTNWDANQTSHDGMNFIQKTLICSLDNIYFYTSLIVTLYTNYLIGCGVLYDKTKDRHRVTINLAHCYRNMFISSCIIMHGLDITRPASFTSILSTLWSTLANVTQTVEENIIKIKSSLAEHGGMDQEDLQNAYTELDKILHIFTDIKNISDLFYSMFMKESPFENLIKSISTSESLLDIITPASQYIFNNFENIDPKLYEKLLYAYTELLWMEEGSTNKLQSNYTLITDRADINRCLQDKSNGTIYILGGRLTRSTDHLINFPEFMDYWTNKAPKPLLVFTTKELDGTNIDKYGNNIDFIGYALFNKFRQTTDSFTAESTFMHPLNFKFLLSNYFVIIPPGARNIETLVKREITLQEKVAVSLFYFNQIVTHATEDEHWKKSTIPEFGIRVHY